MPTGKQIRAARMLVDWDADDLARRVSMSRVSIQNIERGDTRPKPETIDKIIQAFSEVGIEFTENEGLRRRPCGVEIFEGPERFDSFYTFLYEHLKVHGGDVCLSVTDEGLLAKYRRNPSLHYSIGMYYLCDKGTVKSFRILANKSDFASKYSYNTYKWQISAALHPRPSTLSAIALRLFHLCTAPRLMWLSCNPLPSPNSIARLLMSHGMPPKRPPFKGKADDGQRTAYANRAFPLGSTDCAALNGR